MIKASPYEKNTILFYDYEAYSALVCPFLYSASLVNLAVRKSIWIYLEILVCCNICLMCMHLSFLGCEKKQMYSVN